MSAVSQSFYKSKPMRLPGALILRPPVFEDDRGYFSPTFNSDALGALGIGTGFVQDNQSLSHESGTVRGLHGQIAPFEQAKLVRVLQGSIFDVLVDIRPGSSHFGQWDAHELTAASHEQIYVPRGFLHGFMTLEPDTIIAYKVDSAYAPDHEVSIMWNDQDLAIDWPDPGHTPILSGKDSAGLSWTDFKGQG